MSTRDVSPAEAQAMLSSDPKTVYLDVRTEGEFEAGHPRGVLTGRIVEAGWADAGLPVEVGATPGKRYADLAVKR
jgi:hypothetical protein